MHGGFFALRAPALPFTTLEQWSAGVEAPATGDGPALDQALERDTERLETRLRALLARPEVRGAVFVASPDLDEALAARPSPKVRAALVRYVARMAWRSTPFGLFAGCGVGRIGARTSLTLPARSEWQRHTRLDANYLDALIRGLGGSEELRDAIVLRPNGSLWRQGGQLRYVESRLDGRERSHHLVELEDSPHLERALAAARDGAHAPEIAAAVAAHGVAAEAAARYVRELVHAQVLVPELDVSLTGPAPLDALLADLDRLPPARGSAAVLERVRADLRAIDAEGFAASPARHRAVAAALTELPAEVPLERLFQVDTSIPCRAATLGEDAVAELVRAVELLRRLALPRRSELDDFKEAFGERYEARAVPLLEALDDELGVGFGRSGDAADPAPLLRDLALPGSARPQIEFGGRERHLLRLLQRCWSRREHELVLSAVDVEALSLPDPAPLPDALAALATIARTRSGPRFLVVGVDGPSGARLLGRFCHDDPDLAAAVRAHLRAEEALDPEAIFAEVAHLPSGWLANILARPVLREWEIEWLGRSGAPPERRLPASDLLVSLRDDRVVLTSQRFGRRVVPRLTSAHNWARRSPGVYRFLCAVQSDGRARGLAWQWEPFTSAPFLPRLRHGRLVLARARWNLTRDELRPLRGDAWRAVQGLRAQRGLPRWVMVADRDHRLPVDLDNALCVDAFARLVRERDDAVLEELFPGPDELVARGSDGLYAHELVVPLVRAAPVAPAPKGAGAATAVATASAGVATRRIFAPGSAWVYLKLYTGTATADRLLRREVGPLAARLVEEGAADSWFFLRYRDSGYHLRVRLHGDPDRLRSALEGLAERALARGLAHDAAFGTYQREIERYGGPAAIELVERIFHADSEATIALLGMFEPGEAGLDERWRIGLLGAHVLMCDLGLGPEERRAQAERMAATLAGEQRLGAAARRKLGERFRTERESLDALLQVAPDAPHPLAPGAAVLARRSARITAVAADLRRRSDRLTVPLPNLAVPLVHMWLNRLSRSANRRHEWVTYELLRRLYEAQASRGRRAGARGAPRSGGEPA